MDLPSPVVGYSRWALADPHVHTPADFHHRYGDVGGPQPNAAFAATSIKAHADADADADADAGVTVMGVTDHNMLSWYPMLAYAGRAYGVTLFPCVEFNVN